MSAEQDCLVFIYGFPQVVIRYLRRSKSYVYMPPLLDIGVTDCDKSLLVVLKECDPEVPVTVKIMTGPLAIVTVHKD